MKKHYFLAVALFACSAVSAQNLTFSDAKFKALLLTSNTTNGIAKDTNGNSFAIDANNDGEIQQSEADKVIILNVKMDETKKYDASGNINYPYYFSHLPENISDALLFTNIQELYISDTKSAVISYINNSKIKKIISENRWFTKEESFNGSYYETDFYPVDFTIDNCSSISSMDDISASFHPNFLGQAIFRIKNNPQFNGALSFNGKLVSELYFENINFTSIEVNDSRGLVKLSVPNMGTLKSIKINNSQDGLASNQEIDLIANDCTSLEEIVLDGDNYDNHSVYLSAINVNGNSSLKKIKGLNAPTVDFTSAGLTNLEELDCAYYNRYIYTGHQDRFTYWGNVSSVNLSGLPNLKIFKAFNQPLTQILNIQSATLLTDIDLTNSAARLTSLNVSNLPRLTTLKVDRVFENASANKIVSSSKTSKATLGTDLKLKEINAENCPNLMNFDFYGNINLEKLNVKNSVNLTGLHIGSYMSSFPNMPSFYDLNIENAVGLTDLKIENTNISNLNTSKTKKLATLELTHNKNLVQLDLKNNVNLTNLTLGNLDAFVETDFSKNTLLESVDFMNMPQLKKVDLSNQVKLDRVSFFNTPSLEFVNIHNNAIESNVGFDMVSSNLTVCVDQAQLQSLKTDFPDINFITNCDSVLSTSSESKIDFSIFPNPASDYVEIKSADKILSVEIFDAQGRSVFTNKNLDANRLDVSKLHSGLYLIKVQTNKGVKIQKLLKK